MKWPSIGIRTILNKDVQEALRLRRGIELRTGSEEHGGMRLRRWDLGVRCACGAESLV